MPSWRSQCLHHESRIAFHNASSPVDWFHANLPWCAPSLLFHSFWQKLPYRSSGFEYNNCIRWFIYAPLFSRAVSCARVACRGNGLAFSGLIHCQNVCTWVSCFIFYRVWFGRCWPTFKQCSITQISWPDRRLSRTSSNMYQQRLLKCKSSIIYHSKLKIWCTMLQWLAISKRIFFCFTISC